LICLGIQVPCQDLSGHQLCRRRRSEASRSAFQEDADAGAAELAYRLGFAGGAWGVSEVGRVNGVVEGVGAEGAFWSGDLRAPLVFVAARRPARCYGVQ
jgi:hypothetical protein